MQYICVSSKTGCKFTAFEYICLRAIFQDHYIMAFPSIHLFLSGNYRLLDNHLHELVDRFKNNPIIHRNCIHILISLMEKNSLIDSHQVRQLNGLCQNNDPKLFRQFLLFQEKSDIPTFLQCLKNRLANAPLQPPCCPLRLSEHSWTNIPHADPALVQSGIRLVALREARKISSEECLNGLYHLMHPSEESEGSIGDRELSLTLFMPSAMDYPYVELMKLIQSEDFTTMERSYLYYKCNQSSLSLVLCYHSLMQTGNRTQFVDLCKLCLEAWKQPHVFTENHSKILCSLLSSKLIDAGVLSVVQQEYCDDRSNIFYQAFSIAEKDQNLNNFACALKKLAALYISSR